MQIISSKVSLLRPMEERNVTVVRKKIQKIHFQINFLKEANVRKFIKKRDAFCATDNRIYAKQVEESVKKKLKG